MCNFAAMEGVCDTPLHLFAQNNHNTMVKQSVLMLT